MFWQRALISFTLGPLALYVIYLGGWYYFVPITAILLLATVEYHHIMQQTGLNLPLWLLLPLVSLLIITSQWFSQTPYLEASVTMGLFVPMTYALWLYEKKQTMPSHHWFALTGGVLVLGWTGGHFLRLRGLEQFAWQWTMLAMLSTWIADSAAYVVGRFLAGSLLGRHQLSPHLSPNKTIEGYIGGVVLGTFFTLIIAYYLKIPQLAAWILGLFISLVSPAGDLGISLIKRQAGVKDSGRLFGGHGGALDRIDSLVWSVTFAYYLALFFQ